MFDEPTRARLLGVLERARELGFLGPGPVEDQLEHALGFERMIAALPGPATGNAVDLGSGGGVPGLVLALTQASRTWLLVDAMVKRVAFLEAAVSELGLADRVSVVLERAETFGRTHRGRATLVVARSFGAPAVLAECAAPLLQIGGHLVVSEPPGGDPARWPSAPLAALGLQFERLEVGPPSFALLRQIAPTPATVPRRVGLPGKQPRW